MLVLTLLFSFNSPDVLAQSPRPPSDQQIERILGRLSPEEKIGQLFLVTFNGTDVGPESEIFKLITNYHVGGIVLLSGNDNFSYISQSPDDTAIQLRELTTNLQDTEWAASQRSQGHPITGEIFFPEYIPIFIGLAQEGDGYPFDQIFNGITILPNSISIGATWNPELSDKIGQIMGLELSTLGINLLLGPSLDVLESPQTEANSDLGSRSFGGDPYWVEEMGRAFIRGVHNGSEGRITVVAKHFPGHGGADRLPEEEVATVRKPLEELINFDLAPFFGVTGEAIVPEETADALLTSHIRYQGLQGNIRATTRPVSFDPQALNLLIELPSLSSWREDGGILISDNLGSTAVRKFYDLTNQEFDVRRVATNAFLAGNDMLYIADFQSLAEPDPYISAVNTLDFFAQKYREDNAFAQRVDESVRRILKQKLHIYENFSFDQIIEVPASPSEPGVSEQKVFEIAWEAATLVSPTQTELDETIPDPPNQNDRIVFFSDTRSAQQCSQCSSQSLVSKNALQEFVIRRYGPQAGGQIVPNNLSSYSLSDLQNFLNSDEGGNILSRDLDQANWVVFTMLTPDDTEPSFQTLRQFLNERPDLLQQKRIIVFALNAPYFLDATNISKLTAYYSLYSKTPQFVDVAAYLLFRELRPVGASPVSIPGINYDLNKALFPHPDQVIPLTLDFPETELSNTSGSTIPLDFEVRDVIPVRTGVIIDNNSNQVPDGTPVEFILTIGGDASITRQIENTIAGVARSTFTLASPGALEIHAESEPAVSESLKFDIPSPDEVESPIETLEIPTPSPIPTSTPQSISPVPEQPPSDPIPDKPNITDWLMAVMVSIVIAWSSYRLSALIGQVRWGVRAGFLAAIFGLLAYSYLVLNLPGSEFVLQEPISRSIILVTFTGTLIGLLILITWKTISEAGKQPIPSKEENNQPKNFSG
ncbi:glycoside hydrolase family 3 N-terminal domain-containing protein [Chloroflexota bacterium]